MGGDGGSLMNKRAHVLKSRGIFTQTTLTQHQQQQADEANTADAAKAAAESAEALGLRKRPREPTLFADAGGASKQLQCSLSGKLSADETGAVVVDRQGAVYLKGQLVERLIERAKTIKEQQPLDAFASLRHIRKLANDIREIEGGLRCSLTGEPLESGTRSCVVWECGHGFGREALARALAAESSAIATCPCKGCECKVPREEALELLSKGTDASSNAIVLLA